MRGRNILWILAFFILASCSTDSNHKKDSDDALAIPEGVPFERSENENTQLIISHFVADYDVWKATFDLAESVRLKYGITTKHVYKGLLDSNLAVVTTEIQDIDTARHYVNSDQLYKSMELAGVIGEVKTFYMKERLNYSEEANDTILMFMSFKVINYDRWEKAFLKDFLKDGDNRDFEVIKVLQGVEQEDEIAMLFRVNDPEYVQKMEKNSAFRMKMIASGVISYPLIYKLNEQLI